MPARMTRKQVLFVGAHAARLLTRIAGLANKRAGLR